MNKISLERFQAVVAKHLTNDALIHMQRLAEAASNESQLPSLKKDEVLKLGMYSMPLDKLPHEGTEIGQIEETPVLWIGALGAYALKDDPACFVINLCHPYRQPALEIASALNY